MLNPFRKRATEYLSDSEDFLSVTSPEPITYWIAREGKSELFDRLVLIAGTPGSGKTTIATVFEYRTLEILARRSTLDSYKALHRAVNACGALSGAEPTIIGYRIPIESEYRNLWELPYTEAIRLGILKRLVQARAVLGWLRALKREYGDLQKIGLNVKGDDAAINAAGAHDVESLQNRARHVEEAVYRVSNALLPPMEQDLPSDITSDPYSPFDVLRSFDISSTQLALRPLLMLDDAHVLHRSQLRELKAWLMRRELKFGRWILTRLDALEPSEITNIPDDEGSGNDEETRPGVKPQRDVIYIYLQRANREKKAFRKFAQDVADRYLQTLDPFSRSGLKLQTSLSTRPTPLSNAQLRDLEEKVIKDREELHISTSRYEEYLSDADSFLRGQDSHIHADEKLALTSILMHRYARRTPQRSLFGEDDIEPNRPVHADTAIWEAAQIHLMHEYKRPFYYGIEKLCDAAGGNIEQFLHLSAGLVDAIETRIIRRRRTAELDARTQHDHLVRQAVAFIDQWDFPLDRQVRKIVTYIGDRCKQITLEKNAWIGAGANAYGVPQDQMERMSKDHPRLERVLHFALAYNVITLSPNYSCKGKLWCLIELSGTLCIAHGLTLKRGGFDEGDIKELSSLVEDQ